MGDKPIIVSARVDRSVREPQLTTFSYILPLYSSPSISR
jgi:hypothetical protein